MGVSGNRSVPNFYPEGRTYTPPMKSAVILLALQVQAPAEAADVALLAEGSDNHASIIIGTAERQSQND